MQRYAMVATENGEELQPIAKGELIRIDDLIVWLDAQGDAAMEQAKSLQEGTDEHRTIGNVVQHYRFVATSLRLELDDKEGRPSGRCLPKEHTDDQLSLVAKWLAFTSPVVHELFLKEFLVQPTEGSKK